MTEDEMKKWIDGASYEELLRKWRFGKSGSPWFRGHVGEYFGRVMSEKKAALPPGEAATVSKRLGF